MHELIGAIHIHSIFSDGSGEIPDIASAAGEVGLDFIMITDHNTMRGLSEGYEKWYGETLVLIGCEINDKFNQNHYLAFGIDEAFSTRMPAKEYVEKVKRAGGIGFLAHPHEKRNSMKEHPPYPWTAWDAEGFTGIEIWNHMSEWMEGLTEQNKFNYFIHPLKSILSPNPDSVRVWDKIALTRPVTAIGGVDAHAHKVNLLGFFEVEVFPYKVLFKSVRTHILVKNDIKKHAEERVVSNSLKAEIYGALAAGSCYISNFYYGDAKGFRFFGSNDYKRIEMGSSTELSEGLFLHAEIPSEGAAVRFIRNGSIVFETESQISEYKVKDPGVYRVEVYKNQHCWIFSNHIRIGL